MAVFGQLFLQGTCVKAVCSRLSQRQHAVGCQVKPCGCDCQSGHLIYLRAQVAVKTVREWIRQNPLWKQKIMSRELNLCTLITNMTKVNAVYLHHNYLKKNLTVLAVHSARCTLSS
jgi:hypothetical protein